MELTANNLLFLNATFGSLYMLIYTFKRRFSFCAGWAGVTVICLVLVEAGVLYFPDYGGYISGSVFIIFVLIPSIGFHHLHRLMLHRNYDQAIKVARFVKLLHPADGYIEQVKVIDALRSAKKGDFRITEQLLEKLTTVGNPVSCLGIIQLLSVQGKWEEMLNLYENKHVVRIVNLVPSLAVYRLRALVETGRLHDALEYYRCLKKEMPTRVYEAMKKYRGLDISLFAFTGRVKPLQKLLKRMGVPDGTSDYWMAIACFVSGDVSARDRFIKMAEHNDPIMQKAIEYRLRRPPEQNPELSEEEEELLAELERELDQSCRYDHRPSAVGKSYVTFVLAGAILLMFAVELYSGGSTNLFNVWRLGALDPYEVYAGNYWRLLVSIFLHYGWLHVSMNVVALIYFGSFVESSLGHLHYMICYFFSGLGSALSIVLFTQLGWTQPMIVAGASGAIMGIVGSEAAILLRGWRTESSTIAQRRLQSIIAIFIFQFFFDLITPQISFSGHITGALLGFSATIILQRMAPIRKIYSSRIIQEHEHPRGKVHV